ncbi:hypothetical protein M0R04_05120 [Candidatus Dojkabacteria bacterium]|jgi:hypothetical protein|nr:hypothetical protein [Candidatus Dojkabacteria bacterium]
MSLWGNKDQANNAPKSTIIGGLGVNANGEALFGNTQVSAFVTGMAVGDFGVDAVEAGIAGEGKKVQHAGWNLRKEGIGPVQSIRIANGGTNYNANGWITFTGGGSLTAANASYTVNTTTNTITTITLVNGGSFTSTPYANVANGTTVNAASLVVTMGGRANRVQMETLVAMGSITLDAENAKFPNS